MCVLLICTFSGRPPLVGCHTGSAPQWHAPGRRCTATAKMGWVTRARYLLQRFVSALHGTFDFGVVTCDGRPDPRSFGQQEGHGHVTHHMDTVLRNENGQKYHDRPWRMPDQTWFLFLSFDSRLARWAMYLWRKVIVRPYGTQDKRLLRMGSFLRLFFIYGFRRS